MLESNLELAFSMKHEAFGVRVRADDKEKRLKVLPPTTRFVNPRKKKKKKTQKKCETFFLSAMYINYIT